MAKGPKVTPPTKSINVDLMSEHASDSEDDMLDDLKDITLPSMCNFLETIEKQEETLEKQEDLLIFEKEKNLELECALATEKEKNDILSKMLKMTKSSCVNIENSKKTLQDDYDCLDKSFKALKLMIENLKENNVSTCANVLSKASTNSSIEICTKCKDIDVNAYTSNIKTIQVLTSQNEKLKSLLHNGFLKCHKGSKALKEVLGA